MWFKYRLDISLGHCVVWGLCVNVHVYNWANLPLDSDVGKAELSTHWMLHLYLTYAVHHNKVTTKTN